MARRRRRNGRFAGLSMGPLLSKVGIKDAQISSQDAFIGAAVGVAAALASRYVENLPMLATSGLRNHVTPVNGVWPANATFSDKFWDFCHNNLPGLGSVAAGAAMYFLGKKSSAAYGRAVGAAMVGVGQIGIAVAQAAVPQFRGLVRVNLGGVSYGFLARDSDRGSLGGLLVRDSETSQFGMLQRDPPRGGTHTMPLNPSLSGLRRAMTTRARALS